MAHSTQMQSLITDEQQLISAAYDPSGYSIPVYDDGFGQLYILRDSLGVRGICRAKTWEDAYSICEDEFFPEADETMDELIREYGFKREHVKIVMGATGEREAKYPDDYPNGKLAPTFVRWETRNTPDPEAWIDNELFQEAFGFRPNGPNKDDVHKHGIYAKDLNGESLDILTQETLDDIGIKLTITEYGQ